MKKPVFALLYIIFSVAIKAQDIPKYTKSLKLYNYIPYASGPYKFNNSINLTQWHPAFVFEKANGNFREIQLTTASREKFISQNNFTGLFDESEYYHVKLKSLGFRFENNIKLYSPKNLPKLGFYGGYFAEMGMVRYKYQGSSGQQNEFIFNQKSFELGFVPRIKYALTDRLAIDVSMPISAFRLWQLSGDEWNVDSKTIEHFAQPFRSSFFENYNMGLRAGISFKF